MVVDARREAQHVYKQMGRMQNTIGEAVVWFKFDTANSNYDDVYDEGGREYLPGVLVPMLWVDDQEAAEVYDDQGRRPTQRIRFAVSGKQMWETLGDITEAHGARWWDTKPDGKPWWNDRLNDLVYYGGRFYEVSNYQIRGRIQETDLIIGVTGIETQPQDERVWDLFPSSLVWS